LIKGNLTVNDKLCVVNLLTAKNGLDVTDNVNVDGGLTVVQDAFFEGNVTINSLNMTGNIVGGNLVLDTLYVHKIFGLSPVQFDIANFAQGANFKQGLGNAMITKMAATNGGKLMLDGCDHVVTGGNVMITNGGKLMLDGGDHIVMGGNLSVMDTTGSGGGVHIDGGNITVTGHSLNGRGSIAVLDGGDIYIRNGGSITVSDGGNVIINNGGNLILGGGGTLVMVDDMGMTQEALKFPITEVQGGTNQTTYTIGDLIYASDINTLAKLPIGSSNQILTVSGGIPSWTTASPTLSIYGATQVALSQSVPSGAVGAIITFDTVNPNNISPPGSLSGMNTFTVNTPGWFMLDGAVNFGAVITNTFGLDFLINGVESSECIGDIRLIDSAVLPARMHINCSMYLTNGDMITLRARQTNGGAVSIVTASIRIQLL
jgi:hypothetical protein